MIEPMDAGYVGEAIELLEKANADLEPELMRAEDARRLLEAYARAERLAAFGLAALARKLDDAAEMARVTGTSVGKAKAVVTTGKAMASAAELGAAFATRRHRSTRPPPSPRRKSPRRGRPKSSCPSRGRRPCTC